VVIGVGAGAKVEFNLHFLMVKRARMSGSTLRPRPLEGKADAARRVERNALPLVEAGLVHVPVADTFTLDRVEDAYERFAAGGKVGKVVLLMH
jgi:NADPH:quinone reductase-like Zn-dependent oxidoreductase